MKILAVDDDAKGLYALRVILENEKHLVETAQHGKEALEKARASPPDLIISDILMPIMDGFTLCRKWHEDESLKKIPFIFYTATYTEEKDEELALSLGAVRVLKKPMDPEALLMEIHGTVRGIESGLLPSPGAPFREEVEYLKLYNERLVKKLEDKMLQLEETNRSLERDIIERKRSEQELRLSRELFSNAFNVGPAGMTITRIADGKFIDANESFVRIFEFSREEVIGHTSTELNMLSLEERGKLIQQQLESGGLHHFELLARSKSGRLINLLFSSKPMEVRGETCHVTTMIDITERKKAEDELRNSREQLRSLSARLQFLREEERTRIAREVHDELGQTLTGLKFDLSWFRNRVSKVDDSGQMVEKINSMSKLV